MLKEYILILIKGRKTFLVSVFIVTALSVVISLVLPKWYLAEASFLPPELATNTLINMGGGLSQVIQSFTGQRNTSGYNYMAILESRTLNEEIVHEFKLIEAYHVRDSLMSKTLKKLRQNVKFTIGDNNETIISVYDKDPVKAAAIANHYLYLLNLREKELAKTELNTFLNLIEERVRDNESKLKSIQDRIETFQRENEIPVVINEDMGSMNYIGDIYVQKLSLELQKDFLEEMYGRNHPQIKLINKQLININKRVAEIPEISTIYMEIYRELLIQQKIMEFLIPMYEQVKLSAEQKVPDVLVIDKAIPPDRKNKPKRILIVLSAAILSSICSFYYLLIRDRYEDELEDFWIQVKSSWK